MKQIPECEKEKFAPNFKNPPKILKDTKIIEKALAIIYENNKSASE